MIREDADLLARGLVEQAVVMVSGLDDAVLDAAAQAGATQDVVEGLRKARRLLRSYVPPADVLRLKLGGTP